MAVYGAQPTVPGLEEELMRRRSAQAGVLQQDQAAMGGLGQAPPSPMPTGGMPSGPPGAQGQTFSGVMQQRQQQAQTLQQRQADLQIGERIMQLFDPRLPRPTRQFLFRELSRQVGVDPKGEQAKEIGAMVTALDPQSLEGLRRNMASRLQNAQPGEITQLTRGLLTGQVPITELITPGAGAQGSNGTVNITSAGAQGGGGAPASTPAPGGGSGTQPGSAPFPGMMGLGMGGQGGAAPGQPGDTIPSTAPGAPLTIQPGAAPAPSPGVAPEASTPPYAREIAPELASILGLETGQRYRNIDVARAGFGRIPTDYADQQKMATDVRGLQDGVISTLSTANALHGLIAGRPDALNFSLGRLPWVGEVTLPNPSSVMVQIRGAFDSFTTGLGLTGSGPRVGDDADVAARNVQLIQQLTERFGSQLAKQLQIDPNQTQDAASLNSRVQALLVNLAFSMAAAQGQTGRNLSDRDLELQLQALGRSNNPEQFQSAIETTIQRIYAQYRTRTAALAGAEIPLGHVIPPDIAQTLTQGPVTPPHLVSQLTAGQELPPNRGRPLTIAQPSPAAAEGPVGAPRGTWTDPHTFVPNEIGDRVVSQTPQGPPAPMPNAVPLARTAVPRQGPTLEQEETVSRQRATEDRAAVLAERAANARRLEIAESQEHRAARAEVRAVEEARRQRIRDAFAQVAQAFRGGSGAAGISAVSGAGGAEQDPRAFQITPAPQRRAPEPIDASRFRRN